MKWELKSLDEIGFIGRGKSKHRPRNAAHLYGGSYPFIQTGDIKAANLTVTEYTQTYSEEGLAQSKLWKEGTLCITIAANIADTAILGMDACFPDSVIGFIPYEGKSDVRFVKYFFDIFQARMKSVAVGAAQDNLSLEKLLTFKIPIPPFPIQQKIASILSVYDDLIENNLKRIRLLEEKALLRFNSMFESYGPLNKFSNLPNGWEVKRADEIFNISIGKTPPREQSEWFNDPESKVKWISIKDMNGASVFILDTNETVTQMAISKFNMNVAKIGTVILSFKLTVGKVAITTEEMTTNEAIAHFNAINEARMCVEFIYFYLKNFPFNSLGSTSSIGTAINSKVVKAMPILLPPLKILNIFKQDVANDFRLVFTLLKQNTRLRQARDILLPRLMNGEISV